jgi:hypothetical protein
VNEPGSDIVETVLGVAQRPPVLAAYPGVQQAEWLFVSGPGNNIFPVPLPPQAISEDAVPHTDEVQMAYWRAGTLAGDATVYMDETGTPTAIRCRVFAKPRGVGQTFIANLGPTTTEVAFLPARFGQSGVE